MKLRRILLSIMVISIIVLAVNTGAVCAYTEIVKSGIAAKGDVPLNQTPILDNFNTNKPGLNAWNCVTGTFVSEIALDPEDPNSVTVPSASCSVSYVPDSGITNNVYSLKIDYDVSIRDSYAGYYSKLGTSEVPPPQADLRAFKAVSFMARAESEATNPRGFKVELHDYLGTGNGEPFYKIDAWVDSHPSYAPLLTANWQKYTIPFTEFKDWSDVPLDTSRVAELVFTMEWWNTEGVGEVSSIYIDDIKFE